MTPPCFNRQPFTDPNAGWVATGERRATKYRIRVFASRPVLPVLRYRHPWFTDRCTVHDKADIGPSQTYAQAHGWDCSGCRLLPETRA